MGKGVGEPHFFGIMAVLSPQQILRVFAHRNALLYLLAQREQERMKGDCQGTSRGQSLGEKGIKIAADGEIGIGIDTDIASLVDKMMLYLIKARQATRIKSIGVGYSPYFPAVAVQSGIISKTDIPPIGQLTPNRVQPVVVAGQYRIKELFLAAVPVGQYQTSQHGVHDTVA